MSKDRAFEDLRSLGEFLRQQVPSTISEQAARAAVGKRRPRRSRSWIVIVVTAALFAVGNAALAQASDPAVRGDLLYPLDRAYEWFGDRFGPHDRVTERVQEALQLAETGETDLALATVQEILASQAATVGLEAEVGRLVGSGNSQAVSSKVKDLISAASLVHEAAQTGDASALQTAIAKVKQEASEVAETASDGQAGGGNQITPLVTAPGQIDNPSGTAPGQIDNPPGGSPSDIAPGQTKASDKPNNGGANNNEGGQGRGNDRGSPKP